MKLTDFQLGYLVGMIDGEGHITIINSTADYFSPRVTITNTSREVLEFIQSFAGGGLTNSRGQTEQHKAVQELCWHGASAIDMCKELAPHLFLKRAQAILVSEFPLNGNRSRRTEEMRLSQAVCYIQLKKLNKKGPTGS